MSQKLIVDDFDNRINASQSEAGIRFFIDQRNITNVITDLNPISYHYEFYELIWVQQGEGSHTVDFEKYCLNDSSIVLVAPGQVHEWDEGARIHGFQLRFTEDIFDDYYHTQIIKKARLFNRSEGPDQLILSKEHENEFNQLVKLLQAENSKQDRDINIIRPLLMSLLYSLTRLKNQKISQWQQGDRLDDLENIIEKYYRTESSLEFYAKQLNIGIKQLNSISKKIYDKTALSLIHDRILLEAKRELMMSRSSIKVIAFELGFEDPSYFSRFFRRYTSSTPSQYRAKLQLKK